MHCDTFSLARVILLSALCSSCVAMPMASAAPLVGAFVPAGTLSENISQVSGVALSDGRVLITETWKAEVYLPGQAQLSPFVEFQGSHYGGTAIALDDGRLLVAGTPDASAHAVSAEVIAPDNATIAATGSMVVPRYGASLTMLTDGRIFVWGGFRAGTGWPPISQAEIFDPHSNSFAAAGAALAGRWAGTLTTMADGRDLLVGGSTEDQVVQQVAQIYDPETNTATPTGASQDARWMHAAILLNDGRVLICGGMLKSGGQEGATNKAMVYNPQNAHFTPVGNMVKFRFLHTLTLLSDGRVLVVGGKNGGGGPLNDAEVFDPTTNQFSALDAHMAHARWGHAAIPSSGGRVIIASGADLDGSIESVEAFVPDSIFTSSFD